MSAVAGPEVLLQVEDLSVAFGDAPAVEGVSFTVHRGETLGIVGESGSGKSTVGLAIMGLLPRSARAAGAVRYDGVDLRALPERQLRARRGRDIGLVYQDPMAALNPVKTIGSQMREVLQVHLGMTKRQADSRAAELLGAVGIDGATAKLKAYPHEFSGGMRQRVVIAMAVSCNPGLIIADEPTTALDVSVQAQVLELLEGLTREMGIALIMISHDLSIVAGISRRVAVMRSGRILEHGETRRVFEAPEHPYTRQLIERVREIEDSEGAAPALEVAS